MPLRKKHMKDPNHIQQLRQIPITEYLANAGFNPVRTLGNQFAYCSPKTNEKSPSFLVNPEKNVFYDWSGGGKGDILSLVQYLNDCGFLEAVAMLESFSPTADSKFFFVGGHIAETGNNAVEVVSVGPLAHGALWQYVEGRKIPRSTAFKYLREVHYQTKGKRFFAVGFGNDGGGYELRNSQFKGCVSPKRETTLTVAGSNVVSVFEGFFDFLSALAHFGRSSPRTSVVVLNSLSNLKSVLPYLTTYDRINAFLDNDQAGRKGLDALRATGAEVADCSNWFHPYKDFNEFLCSE